MHQHSKIQSTVLPFLLATLLAACTGGTGEEKKVAAPAAPDEDRVFTLAIELADEIELGALQVDFDYSDSVGGFVGDADAVECETVVEGALSSYNNQTAERILKAAFVAVDGMSGPIRIAECKWKGVFDPATLGVEVRDASAPDLSNIAPLPELRLVIED
ncbi:MAG: hypothetical protein ACI8TX_002618 [Hyphomicrobiaceae bacterium]|jgi:hypothetical protein